MNSMPSNLYSGLQVWSRKKRRVVTLTGEPRMGRLFQYWHIEEDKDEVWSIDIEEIPEYVKELISLIKYLEERIHGEN